MLFKETQWRTINCGEGIGSLPHFDSRTNGRLSFGNPATPSRETVVGEAYRWHDPVQFVQIHLAIHVPVRPR